MKKLLVAFLLLLTIPTKGHNVEYQFPYGKETIQMTEKVLKVGKKYPLEYKNINDLQESIDIIIKQSKYSKFNKYELTSVVMVESRFNSEAISPVGAKGLGQLYNIKNDYNKELFWINNVYDKHQNVIGSIIILEDKLKSYKTKRMAYIRYSGGSRVYLSKVIKIKKELERV